MNREIPVNLAYELPPPPPRVHRHTLPRHPHPHAHRSSQTRSSRTPRTTDNPNTTPEPSFRTHVRSYPTHFMVLGMLLVFLILDIAGLAMYMILVPKANEGGFITFSILFVVIMILIAGFVFRQSIILYNLIHPIPVGRTRQPSNLPTWLTGLPTYRDVLRSDGQPTRSTDSEGWSGMLPSYGDAKGDELLMKSSIRESRDLEMGVIEGRAEDVGMTVEVMRSSQPAPVATAPIA